jgi:hypothetical protein
LSVRLIVTPTSSSRQLVLAILAYKKFVDLSLLEAVLIAYNVVSVSKT